MRIKNLKLNFDCLKKMDNLKRNVKQLKNTVIAGVLALSLTSCGFSNKSSTNSNISNTTPASTTVATIQKESLDTYDYLKLYNLDVNYDKYVSASKIEHSDLKITGDLTQSKLYCVFK